MEAVREKARKAKEASYKMATASTDEKNKGLKKIAESLLKRQEEILSANEKDIQGAREKGLPPHLIDRLALNEKRIK
ncbi:MAG: glutamate-5-semialdehyde dehydrogenase, partial [bacterium]